MGQHTIRLELVVPCHFTHVVLAAAVGAQNYVARLEPLGNRPDRPTSKPSGNLRLVGMRREVLGNVHAVELPQFLGQVIRKVTSNAKVDPNEAAVTACLGVYA